MTKYSNRAKAPNQYMKGLNEHFLLRRIGKGERRGNAVVNDCFRPSLGASKADLIEFHKEEMKLRRSGYRRMQEALLASRARPRRRRFLGN